MVVNVPGYIINQSYINTNTPGHAEKSGLTSQIVVLTTCYVAWQPITKSWVTSILEEIIVQR